MRQQKTSMKKLLKKIKKKINDARTIGDWKIGFRFIKPRKNEDYYHELERDCMKQGDFYYGFKNRNKK